MTTPKASPATTEWGHGPNATPPQHDPTLIQGDYFAKEAQKVAPGVRPLTRAGTAVRSLLSVETTARSCVLPQAFR
jgi:hypothetical protein